MRKKLVSVLIALAMGSAVNSFADKRPAPDHSIKTDTEIEYMEPRSNEEYCESIYWEDYDNCIDWHDPDLEITPELCEKTIFASTKQVCLDKLNEISE
jgi:hypothetical protein